MVQSKLEKTELELGIKIEEHKQLSANNIELRKEYDSLMTWAQMITKTMQSVVITSPVKVPFQETNTKENADTIG